MLIWLKKLRVLVDLSNSTYTVGLAQRDIPWIAVRVDLIEIQPGRLHTITKDEPVHMRPATVIYPNAWDAITLLGVISTEINPTHLDRSLFRSDHIPGVRHALHVTGLRRSIGEDAALARRAIEADPALMSLRAPSGAQH